ncbi:MAG: DUF885 family protein, partial [Gemmatimonadota bacterium]
IRSLQGAVEALELESLDDEIDRTMLLDTMRSLEFEFTDGRPHRRNPAFWLVRVAEVLDRGLATDNAVGLRPLLRELPALLETAATTLEKPPRLFLDLGKDLLGPVLERVHRAAGVARGTLGDPDTEALARGATDAAERFAVTLRHELTPDDDEHAFGVGETETDRLLHHRDAIPTGGSATLQRLSRTVPALEAELADLATSLGIGSWQELVTAAGAARTAGDPLEAVRQAIGRGPGVAARLGLPRVEPLAVLAASDVIARVDPVGRLIGRGGPLALEVVARTGLAARAPVLAANFVMPGQASLLEGRRSAPSLVRRTLGSSSALIGFGLYAEELWLELPGETGPALRLLQRADLFRRTLVGAVDLGLHMKRLSPAEATRSLMSRLPLSASEAGVELSRIALRPLEAAASLETRASLLVLRSDWLKRRGPGAALAQFHAELFRFGAMPTSLVRWGLGVDA